MSKKSILYIQYTNPACYPPIEHSSNILTSDGWKVYMLGVYVSGTENIGFSNTKIIVQMLPVSNSRLEQKLRYFVYFFKVVTFYLVHRPTWVYSSEILSFPIALVLANIFRAKVILHEHDTPSPSNKWSQRLFLWCRRRLAKIARLCVIPQSQRAENFEMHNDVKNVKVVWNVPSVEELPKEQKTEDNKFKLWYHGSITPPQFPLTIIDSLAKLPENIILKFAGYETCGHPGYVGKILNSAKEKGIGHRVSYLGTFNTREDLYLAASQCNVGLSLFDTIFREPMAGASNKPFDYLACGLGLVMTDSEEWKIYKDYAQYADPSSSDSITLAIRKWFDDLDYFQRVKIAAKSRILNDWNYENQFAQVKKVLVEKC
jgi:glycosyltransferase involved in cell wall biosynthesis